MLRRLTHVVGPQWTKTSAATSQASRRESLRSSTLGPPGTESYLTSSENTWQATSKPYRVLGKEHVGVEPAVRSPRRQHGPLVADGRIVHHSHPSCRRAADHLVGLGVPHHTRHACIRGGVYLCETRTWLTPKGEWTVSNAAYALVDIKARLVLDNYSVDSK